MLSEVHSLLAFRTAAIWGGMYWHTSQIIETPRQHTLTPYLRATPANESVGMIYIIGHYMCVV